jgi:hypothetical protein
VPNLPSVPVQPILLASEPEFSMFEHFKRYGWVLEPYRYTDSASLINSLETKVIGPPEKRAALYQEEKRAQSEDRKTT